MRLSYLAFSIAVIACGGEPDDAAGTDDGSTGTDSTTATSVTTMTATMPTTSPVDTSGDPAGSSSADGDPTDATTSADEESTAAPGDCAFAATVAEALEKSALDPIDCGAVTLADDAAAWQAARDCARDATLDQLAYKVLWQYDDGGTLRDGAFASEIGNVYAIYRFDDDAAEGTTSITRTTCNGISTPNDCAPMDGEICIVCLRPSEPIEFCD